MKLETGIRRIAAFVLISTLAAYAAPPSRDKNDKSKPSGPVIVDSGAFGIFVRGQRVATETFSVQLHKHKQHHQVAIQGDQRERFG